jgi:hypothetical protein
MAVSGNISGAKVLPVSTRARSLLLRMHIRSLTGMFSSSKNISIVLFSMEFFNIYTSLPIVSETNRSTFYGMMIVGFVIQRILIWTYHPQG